MNTLEEAKALVVKEFERRKMALEYQRDKLLRGVDLVFAYLGKAEEPEELKTVTVGQVDEIRVDQEPRGPQVVMGFHDEAEGALDSAGRILKTLREAE